MGAKPLEQVSETALLPLWARATETLRPDALFRDTKAVEIMRRLPYDFSKFKQSWMSQTGIAVRTEILDEVVGDYLKEYPDGTVVNLGAGFDSRFHRLDNGQMQWFDLDLPEVIRLKRQYFDESERYHLLAQSVLDTTWFERLPTQGPPPLFIAEGVLMYFREPQIRSLLDALCTRFPGSRMAIELLPFGAIGHSYLHEAIGLMDAGFQWSLDDIHQLERWNSHIRVLKQWCILDYHWQRWGWFAWFSWLPLYRLFFGEKLALLSFD